MDRPTVFVNETPRALDFLRLGQFAMVGLAKAMEAVLGTGTVVDGFALTPTAPASLSVILAGGSIYEQETLEATQWSVMPTDSHTIVKQGIALDPTTFTLAPPTTTGYAQCFLVEASFQESDTASTVVNYYNAANPDVPFTGAGNSGSSDNTIRKGGVAIQVKAGIAAASGTQIVPSPDAGWVGLFYVTLAAGATTVTAGNITQYPGAPFIAAKLGQLPAYIQGDTPVFCTDLDVAANTVTVTPIPALAAWVPGQRLKVKMTQAATGPCTITASGLAARSIVRQSGAALVGGEWAVGDHVELSVRDTDLQIVRLTTSDVSTVATSTVNNSTTINSTTQTYIDKSTPRGSTKLSAFSAGVVATDIAITGTGTPFTTTQQTGNITGASYVDASGTCALKDNAGTGSEGSGTMRLRLTDVTAGTTYDSNYVGGGAFNQNVQVSLVIPRFIFVLNPAHTYNLSQICQKGSGVGQTIILDTYIFAQHDGSNL